MLPLSSPTVLVSAPELLVIAFAFITLLGDAWFVLVGLSVLYWIGPRYVDDARTVAAVCVGFATLGLAAVLAFKSATAIPRPAMTPVDPAGLPPVIGSFVAGEIESDGFTFPSGHATAATVVYGGLGLLLSVGRKRLRYLLAASLIVLISLSRVVLEVHYPRDIIAGMVLGSLLIAVGLAVGRSNDRLHPDRLFALGGVASVVGLGVALQGGHAEEVLQAAIGIGTAIGGVLTWRAFGDRLVAAPPVSLPLAVVGLAVAGGLWIAGYAGVLPAVGAVAASAAAVGIILLLPLAAERRKKSGKTETVEA
ncbi:phosphatase PAP2 family protein [Halohasta litorea]|uniref:Phosphatase PAP2 family protein n=1 Tax=Halohasta litorea TaxID=869891 RepID=A0ABD6D951_9EURY|nr:phosphatase PAP2 family protein [Halohasta litorea]MEA1930622.1 phosphatase PAP2 family protein [Euryarchaeota archaeon]